MNIIFTFVAIISDSETRFNNRRESEEKNNNSTHKLSQQQLFINLNYNAAKRDLFFSAVLF